MRPRVLKARSAPLTKFQTETSPRPAAPDDLADTLAFALRLNGRRRKRDAAEMMAELVPLVCTGFREG
jgi:hypothetical protein